MLEGIKDPGRG